MKTMPSLKLAVLLAVTFVLGAVATADAAHRQYYSGWSYHPHRHYYYRHYYYKPRVSYAGYRRRAKKPDRRLQHAAHEPAPHGAARPFHRCQIIEPAGRQKRGIAFSLELAVSPWHSSLTCDCCWRRAVSRLLRLRRWSNRSCL